MPPRVLIVDPDRESAERLARDLVEHGYETRIARDAHEALGTSGFDPDVVVAELRLPGSSGLELLAELSERGVRSRAVLVAANPSFSDCRDAWKLGATEFLARPVDLASLRSAVDAAHAERREPRTSGTLELRAWTSTEDLRRTTREVVAFALRSGALPTARARLGGAIAEILDNVRRHAYRDGEGEVRVTASCEDGAIVVRVVDEGFGFDAVRARLELPAPPLPGEESLPGGLARAAALAESLAVESSPKGTRVTLRVAMTPASFDCEGSLNLTDLDYMDPALAKRILRAARRGRSVDPFHLPPSIAVVIGRLLAGATPSQLAQAALWS